MNPRRQAGATLMETLIALALSMIVTIGMVILMSSTMGTSTRVIQMAQLTDELRNVMSLMTRDVRRANYSANSLYCYGYADCGSTFSVQTSDIVITNVAGNGPCITYQLDRAYLDSSSNWAEPDGNASNDPKGGFRRRVVTVEGDTRGVIEMWTGGAGTAMPNCSANVTQGWTALTNPNLTDITVFTIDDGLSAEQSVTGGSASFTQRQRQLHFALEGELILEQERDAVAGMELGNQATVRRIEDQVTVRNDFIKDVVST